jgi:hypothetical protein
MRREETYFIKITLSMHDVLVCLISPAGCGIFNQKITAESSFTLSELTLCSWIYSTFEWRVTKDMEEGTLNHFHSV